MTFGTVKRTHWTGAVTGVARACLIRPVLAGGVAWGPPRLTGVWGG